MKRTLGLCLLALCLACPAKPGSTPVASYLQFTKALEHGDLQGAYALLSAGTQQRVQQKVDAVARASGGQVKEDPAVAFLAYSAFARPAGVEEVSLVREDGDHASLSVVSGDRKQQVEMVKEKTAWKVDLSSAIKP